MAFLRPEEYPELLELFRRHASKNFGITLIGRDVTLRFTGEDGKRYEVSLVVTTLFDETPTCDNCGAVARLHQTKVTTKLCSGEDERIVSLCYDCFCPK